KRCGVSASRSFGSISGSSLIKAKARSMTSRNSASDVNSLIVGPTHPPRRRAWRRSLPADVRSGTNRLRRAATGVVTLVRDVSAEPIHLHPTAPLAERVLLPGDPGRALRLG